MGTTTEETFCGECGKKLSDDNKPCQKCGSKKKKNCINNEAKNL